MDQHRFFNACMLLMNIDMHELVEAGIIKEGNFDNGGTSWKRFNDEPLMFLAKIDDRKRDALWRLLEERQRIKDSKPELVEALDWALSEIGGTTRYENDRQRENCHARAQSLLSRLQGETTTRWRIYRDRRGDYRAAFVAHGQVLFLSEAYQLKESALNAAMSAARNGPEAPVIDLTEETGERAP